MNAFMTIAELLKCLFCQKEPKLINYSEIGRNSRKGIAIAGEKTV
ncbi:MAG: hypothetical protein NUV76_09720 [Candidatus Kuenenia sp.]|nr:hypothetical protein [Candidatus Kuenenia sp.]